MNYHEFQKKMSSYPLFSVTEIEKQFPAFDRRRLVEWQGKGYIQRLRNRFYCFTDRKTEEPFLYYAANVLYSPSYISLESALSWYGFLTESVFHPVSCSTLKTQAFYTSRAGFLYHHIKRKMYFGYRLESWEKVRYAIADPEKALVDSLYLHPELATVEDIRALRWNRLAIHRRISMFTMDAYVSHIGSAALRKRFELFKEYLHAESE